MTPREQLQKVASMLAERDALERQAAGTLAVMLRQIHTVLSRSRSPTEKFKAIAMLDSVAKMLEQKSQPNTGDSHAN